MINALAERRVLLGVTAGIAAYKAADLVRRLREAGADVRVVMTPGATGFVGPLTFQALSGHPVRVELLDADAEAGMAHIDIARWADIVVVAPATADFLARLAHGQADDLLSTVCLATAAPLVLAPAMNQQMWRAAATQANCALLAGRGVDRLGPDEGRQSCGDNGPGRLVEPPAILAALERRFVSGALAGRSVLVTAGPTREPIDPVRYVSNHSSGRMGYAVARAAAEAGARVTLVSGPTALDTPAAVTRIDVATAEEMASAVRARLAGADIFIGTAAVADYRPAHVAAHKIKKDAATLTLALERTTDILAEAARREPPLFAVGFAAETGDLERYARAKLIDKHLDLVAANLVGTPGIGFNTEDNELVVFWADGQRRLTRAPKDRIARELVALIADRYAQTRAAATSADAPAAQEARA
ncbi:MAG: bifunctional phosphopantothenoylcysteine decarboxylase/phosphopantothenate--cysteine ligase CoaBC [Gammaproteobacteria bacterium]|nr:bifunctional phosphopantothenoylcysteine decarboxylase/phosphopantothenate--cysteine ligase CoaBC [Gammaproteobacteria bacterium]